MTTIELWKTSFRNLQDTTDEELIRLCAVGESEGMEELVRRYQRPLSRFLSRLLDSREDTEQATLNVFIRAWEYAGRFQFRSQVSTWLYRIAANIANDINQPKKGRLNRDALPLEGQVREVIGGDAEEEAMRHLEQETSHNRLYKALKTLSDTDRLLLVLYYFEDRSYEQMETISGLSYRVLKTRLTRARQRLRAAMEALTQETE